MATSEISKTEASASRLMEEAQMVYNAIERLLTNTKTKGVVKIPHEEQSRYTYFTESIFEKTELKFEEAEEFLTSHIDKLHVSVYEQPIDTSSPNRSLNTVQSIPNSFQAIQLPKLELPKFSGDYSSWPFFRDSFRSTIHENENLTGVQKFQYLRASLSGTALDSVSSIGLSNENYQTAWQTLIDLFENKRMLVSSLLNKLFSLKQASPSKLAELTQIRSEVFSVLHSLKNLGYQVDSWDPLVIHVGIQNFDSALRRKWEESLARDVTYPTLKKLSNFLDNLIRPLEAMNLTSLGQARPSTSSRLNSHATNESVGTPALKCTFCSGAHNIYNCPEFSQLTVNQRRQKVKDTRRCWNCLSLGHGVKSCRSPRRCRTCQKPHHSLLHYEQSAAHNVEIQEDEDFVPSDDEEPTEPGVATHLSRANSNPVLLATARVIVSSPEGRSIKCRALIDQGSQASFVSESVAQFLRLKKIRTSVTVSGVGDLKNDVVKYKSTVNLGSIHKREDNFEIQALILQKITSYRPPKAFSLPVDFIEGLTLADSEMLDQDRIDILLGADVYGLLLRDGIRRHKGTSLVAHDTIFGWIISGASQTVVPNQTHVHHFATDSLSEQLRAFWELESVPAPKFESQEHDQCETLFRETTERDPSGRFIVRLPFKSEEDKLNLGDSYKRAKLLMEKLKNRLKANEKLRIPYEAFIKEYQDLGHMSPIQPHEFSPEKYTFLPHHGVIRENKLTTKLRVVVNGSAPTSTGVSLNDVLLAGPKLHMEVSGVIMRWRLHKLVLCTDLEKMFRQILINKLDRRFQCILWYSDDEIKPFELNTVTYGTAPAPFLANRVIREIANQCSKDLPLASATLKNNIYVDDLLFGADNEPKLLETKTEIIQALTGGGFTPKKWMSNNDNLLTEQEKEEMKQLSGGSEKVKVLGLTWNFKSDNFILSFTNISHDVHTKRHIASSVATCFDPLGFLAPLTIRAKGFLQSLWLLKVDWDDELPAPIINQWLEIAKDLSSFQDYELPRWIRWGSHSLKLTLVGFCDASAQAIGVAVYLRVENSSDQVDISLVMSRSKVAPLKTLSIPRLELCAAVLLKDTIISVLENLRVPVDEIRCFSDSQIVLAWINKQPFNWSIFVANRVSSIQTDLPQATWHHVRAKENPADLVS